MNCAEEVRYRILLPDSGYVDPAVISAVMREKGQDNKIGPYDFSNGRAVFVRTKPLSGIEIMSLNLLLKEYGCRIEKL